MSIQADTMRDRRRAFAAPGGAHDRLVAFLGKALPIGVGILAALMVISPLSPRGEVSFLLDRNEVDIAPNRLTVDNAMYRGVDNKGRPFSLTAGNAVQKSARDPVVIMHDLVARILLSDGPALLSAADGRYNFDAEEVSVDGPVQFSAADGYRMVARDVSIDLENRKLVGRGAVEGAIPAGTFSARGLEADLSARTVTLVGDARLRMVPGKLRIPE
ncbi:MAG: LPS export ABC transporter periplasmic protein LptC [Novosphingobium sp.]